MSATSLSSLLRPSVLPAAFVSPFRIAPALATQIGVQALAANGLPGEIPRLAAEAGLSRQTIYELRNRVQERLGGLFEEQSSSEPPFVTLRIDRIQLERAIIGARCVTPSSIRDIMALVPLFWGMEAPSFGFVQGIIAQAETNAIDWMERLPVRDVKAAVLDEIFLHSDPILEVADLESHTILTLSPESSRSEFNWGCVFAPLKQRGLLPHAFISDNGTGITASVKRYFPEAVHRKDGFHVQNKLSQEATRLERRAYKLLNEAYCAEYKRDNPPKKADNQSLVQNALKLMEVANCAISDYDNFRQCLNIVTEAMEFVQLSPCKLKDPQICRQQLAQVASQLKTSHDKRHNRLGTYLANQIDGLIQYMDELNSGLLTLTNTPEEREAVVALAALWRFNRLLGDSRITYSHNALVEKTRGCLERLAGIPDERLRALGEAVLAAIAHRNRASSPQLDRPPEKPPEKSIT